MKTFPTSTHHYFNEYYAYPAPCTVLVKSYKTKESWYIKLMQITYILELNMIQK